MSHLGKPTTEDCGVSRSRVKFVFEICIRRDARRSARSNVFPLERGKVRLIRPYRCNDLQNRLAEIDVKIVRNNEKRAGDRDRMISLDFEIENTVLCFVERSAVVRKKKKKKKKTKKQKKKRGIGGRRNLFRSNVRYPERYVRTGRTRVRN